MEGRRQRGEDAGPGPCPSGRSSLDPGGHNWLDVRFNDIKVNVANAAQTVPESARTPATPQTRWARPLADGVVHMGGGRTTALPSSSRTTSPGSRRRPTSSVARCHRGSQEDLPNKPIRYVVNTHNHFRPSGRLRTYVAEGATVIAEEKNKDFTRMSSWFRAASLIPDRLGNGRLRPRVPVSGCCRRSRTPTRSATAIRAPSLPRRWSQPQRQHGDRVSAEAEDPSVRDTAARRRLIACAECRNNPSFLQQHQAVEAGCRDLRLIHGPQATG